MGIIAGISRKLSEMKKRHSDKKAFFQEILAAVEDGRLSEDEIRQIQARFEELGLSTDDLKGIRSKAYAVALRAASCDSIITVTEEEELAKLQAVLMIPDEEITKSKRLLARLRLLTEIQNGNPPIVSVPNLVLQKSECAYWSESGAIIEERVVRRRYQGGSQGFSFRIAKGVSYRVGGHRGSIVTDTAAVPVSYGDLVITNKRLVFLGDKKSFSIKYDKLLESQIFEDGIRVTDDKGKPRVVKFSFKDNIDIVGALLSLAISNA